MANELSRWVQKQRARKRQTQLQAAAAIGMSRTWISSLERGTFRPKVEEVAALASWARVPLAEVLSLAGYPLSVIASLRTDQAAMPTAGDPDLKALIVDAVREALAATPAARALRPSQEAGEMEARRAYWLMTARKIVLRETEGAIARRLDVKVAEVKSWENGADIPTARLEEVATAYELPVDVLRNPPETDVDVARSFRFRWLAEQRTASVEEVVEQRRRAVG